MSMLDKLRKKAAERHLFTVLEPEAALRLEASIHAAKVGSLEYGQTVLLCDMRPDGWARLTDDEVWASGLGDAGGHEATEDRPWPHVFVLIDGKDFGLPRYLKIERDMPLEEWQYAEALSTSETSGAPWRRVPGGLRPRPLLDLAWLSPWHAPDGTLLEAPPLLHVPGGGVFDWPLPKLCVATMVRGAEPAALESAILMHHSAGIERVVFYFDAPDGDGEKEAMAVVDRFSRPAPTGPGGLMCVAFAVRCTNLWWNEARAASRFYLRQEDTRQCGRYFREAAYLDAKVGDVQARQQIAVDHALHEAQRDGFDWLIHVDADEVLFCPDEQRHGDARNFFHEVPMYFQCVRFANLEAVPERVEMDDPIQEVSLFKMSPILLEELGVEPRVVGFGDIAEEDKERELDLFDQFHCSQQVGPNLSNKFERMPRKERHARRRILAIMHEIAEKRTPILEKLGVKLPLIEKPADKDEEDSDFTDDESCHGPRPHCPAYFNSYSNGKCAVRTQIGPKGEPPPIPAGVHGFVRDGGQDLFELQCKGPGAPVVLHYANCGYTSWRQKYSIICRGHQTADGAFSVERESISSLRPHIAVRELTLRGDEDALGLWYQTFVQGDEYDELAFLAQFGCVLRLEAPRKRLEAARELMSASRRR